jgi:hypothetical protein
MLGGRLVKGRGFDVDPDDMPVRPDCVGECCQVGTGSASEVDHSIAQSNSKLFQCDCLVAAADIGIGETA